MATVSAYKSDVGLRRRQNEDYVWVNDQLGLYIVADGMGGQEAGDVASEMAATTVANLIDEQLQQQATATSTKTLRDIITGAIETANKIVFEAGQASDQKRRMGCTIVVALIQSTVAYISHVGDSRAYLIRDGRIIRLTEDDSWDALLASRGMKGSAEGESPMSHVLTKAIGHKPELKPSFREVILLPQDLLLLCSDGLWNMLNDEQTLAEIQKSLSRPEQVVEALVAAANEAGGKDNISVVAIKLD